MFIKHAINVDVINTDNPLDSKGIIAMEVSSYTNKSGVRVMVMDTRLGFSLTS